LNFEVFFIYLFQFFSELSSLRQNDVNNCSNFVKVLQVKCVRGAYPERLLDLWELYEETHGTENDCPSIFTSEQLYIVLELANCGVDLEAFKFDTAEQAYSVFIQVSLYCYLIYLFLSVFKLF
jgi:serine/threonine-protein kinase haspin